MNAELQKAGFQRAGLAKRTVRVRGSDKRSSAFICGCLRPSTAFTLIEILVAISILSIAMMGVMAVFASAARSHQRGVDGTEAAIIATGIAAEARAVFVERGSLVPVLNNAVHGNPRYFYDIEYIDLDKTGDEVMMRIRVGWSRRGRRTSEVFDTILMRKMQ